MLLGLLMGNLLSVRVSPNFRNIMLLIMEVFSVCCSINIRRQTTQSTWKQNTAVILVWHHSICPTISVLSYLAKYTHTQLEIKFCNIYAEEEGRKRVSLNKQKNIDFQRSIKKTFV